MQKQKHIISDETLLDLIISLGQERGITQLLDKAVSMFKEKLSCIAVYYYQYNDDRTYSFNKSNPEQDTSQLESFIKHFSKPMLLHENNNDFCDTGPNGKPFYFYRLQERNWLVLSREKPFKKLVGIKVREIVNILNNQLALCTKIKPAGGNSDFEKKDGDNHIDMDTFQKIADNFYNFILIAEEDGRVVYANKITKQLLGFDKNKGQEIKVYDFEKYDNDDQIDNWKQFVKELKLSPYTHTNRKLVNYKTKRVIDTEVVMYYIKANGKGYVVANAKNLAKQREIREKIAQEKKLQDVLLRMASKYINPDSLDKDLIINSSLQEIGNFVNADRAYIFEYDFINKTTSNTYEWCSENISPEIENQQNIPISQIPEWLKAYKNKEAVRPYMGVNGLRANLKPQEIKSSITLPMINSGRLIGFIGFDSVLNKKKYSKKEEDLLLRYSVIVMNIGLRQKYESELINQKERFHRIIRSIDLGLIEVDKTFTVVFANESFLRFYNYNWSDLVGRNIFKTILNQNDEKKLKKRLSNIANKDVYTGEVSTFDSQGIEKVVFISIVMHLDKNGYRRYLGAIVDLSPQKKLEKELRHSMHKTEEASKAKELFLANMSHELRTPLNIINGAITEITKEKTSKDTLFLLNQAIAASTHMLNLVNNILDFAKINAGEIKLERKDFELTTTIRKIFNIFSLKAKEKGISYELNICNGIHEYVVGDYNKLNQILINLLGNALKFTETGFVKLQVILKNNYRTRQSLEFIVEDSGIGMNANFLEKIFEEFQQETLVNNIQNGTGLGMPISKRFVNLMGGELRVESKKCIGTKISFNVDFEKRNRTAYEEKTSLKKTLLKGKKILIAEDNYMNAIILERKLSDLGANIHKVQNGKLAIELIEKEDFDLVLMDIQMPTMDGLKTTLAIRKQYGDSLPIIAVTANVFKKSIDQYLNAGMNNVILKPFEDRSLYSKVLESLNIEPKYVLKKGTIPKKNKLKENTGYSLEKLRHLSNGDQNFFNEMISVFYKIAISSIDKLAEGREMKNLDAMRNTAHKLRPSLADLRIDKALKIAEYLDGPQPIKLDIALKKTSEFIKILKDVATDLREKHM